MALIDVRRAQAPSAEAVLRRHLLRRRHSRSGRPTPPVRDPKNSRTASRSALRARAASLQPRGNEQERLALPLLLGPCVRLTSVVALAGPQLEATHVHVGLVLREGLEGAGGGVPVELLEDVAPAV